MWAMLIDTTRCIGCRGCQVACKQWNNLPAEETQFLPAQKATAKAFARKGYQNPRDLSGDTWTLITFNEVQVGGRFEWVFGKLQCMHCGTSALRDEMPACAVSCPVEALSKPVRCPECGKLFVHIFEHSEERHSCPECGHQCSAYDAFGPVTYDEGRCIGCRYCMLACPFQVPKFEWDKALPLIRKCTMCVSRLQEGFEPACVKVCPTDAVVVGEREDLLREAHRRLASRPGNYVKHIYGEHEVGGTCVLHISNVPFTELGYPESEKMPMHPLGDHTKTAMGAIPWVIGGLVVGLGITYTARRRQVEQAGSTGESEGA